MIKQHQNKINYLMQYMHHCPKDFRCITSDLSLLCQAEDVGLENFLLCKEDKPQHCNASIKMSGEHYCDCPLRVYICKNIETQLTNKK